MIRLDNNSAKAVSIAFNVSGFYKTFLLTQTKFTSMYYFLSGFEKEMQICTYICEYKCYIADLIKKKSSFFGLIRVFKST